jgi:excinuclease ABC subunit A
MSRNDPRSVIRLQGVRQNNLKNFDLDLPTRKLVVITGLSGSGKSSLAFDTLFAEGQRRYIETFSPYARQFFDRMDKPKVDRIEGIPPAIAIEQKNSVRTTRSTVGTMTEICDYLKLVWPQVARVYCRGCGQPVRKEPPSLIYDEVTALPKADSGAEWLVTFELPLSDKLPLAESLDLVAKQGYQRLLWKGEPLRIEEAEPKLRIAKPASLTVIQDRLRPSSAVRSRFVEACEQAYHFGKGRLLLWRPMPQGGTGHEWCIVRAYSNHFHCAKCDLDYREPTAALFSFNHPVGACPTCRGFGRIITIDYNLAIPDRSKSLAGGLVKPWQTGVSADCQRDLLKACKAARVPTQVPFRDLSPEHQEWVIQGEPGYGQDKDHEWPHAWYGIKGYFRWLESKAYKMHVRVLLSRYRSYTECSDCHGLRFQPETLRYQVVWPATVKLPPSWLTGPTAAAEPGTPRRITLADFYRLPISTARGFLQALVAGRTKDPRDPLALVMGEVLSRLSYLEEVGLGYLTLDRPTRTLSGGETERVNLTTCLGTRLVNTLFVLDEPSVGLHSRDTVRLVKILEGLRDAGNTVVVVEHEASVMRAADQIIDLGPGQGEKGGHIVFQGSFPELLKSRTSLTGEYLSGRRLAESLPRRTVCTPPPATASGAGRTRASAPTSAPPWLRVLGATSHNLQNLDVDIPLQRMVCLTGVSGSGKTTLVRDVLLPLLMARQSPAGSTADGEETDTESGDDSTPTATVPLARLEGFEAIDRVVLVDQSSLGKTPRSNPVVYIGAFEHIRNLFAETDLAKQRGLNSSGFSFNSGQGQCERCRGAGFEKIEMQFLSDVFIRCPDCQGRRYREHILEVKLSPPVPATDPKYPPARSTSLMLQETLQVPGAQGSRGRRKSVAVASPPPGARSAPVAATATASASAPARSWSIADMLEATVDDAVDFLGEFPGNRHAVRALRSLRLLQEVGLGYLRLGQPINTLSGGESQRLKLVSYLAESAAADLGGRGRERVSDDPSPRTLFLFDEPTTGLHFEDVRVLLKVFHKLVDAGHSLLVIEHHLDVIWSADWVIDLGPEAGEDGGRIVCAGTPERVAACRSSHTGQALRVQFLSES